MGYIKRPSPTPSLFFFSLRLHFSECKLKVADIKKLLCLSETYWWEVICCPIKCLIILILMILHLNIGQNCYTSNSLFHVTAYKLTIAIHLYLLLVRVHYVRVCVCRSGWACAWGIIQWRSSYPHIFTNDMNPLALPSPTLYWVCFPWPSYLQYSKT